MKQQTLYLPIIVFCIALFTGYVGKAQAESAPSGLERIKGYWALPDCGEYEEALAITSRFYLKSSTKALSIDSFTAAPQMDYMILSFAKGGTTPARAEVDGILKLGTVENTPDVWPQSWTEVPLAGRLEYAACHDIPSVIPSPLLRVMNVIDTIAETCGQKFDRYCQRALFIAIDDDKDNMIRRNEFKMAGAMLAGFAHALSEKEISQKDLNQSFIDGIEEADTLWQKFFTGKETADYRDFDGFMAKAASEKLNTAAAKVSAVIPAFAPTSVPLPLGASGH